MKTIRPDASDHSSEMQNQVRFGLFEEGSNGFLSSEIKLTAPRNDNFPAACSLKPANNFRTEKTGSPGY